MPASVCDRLTRQAASRLITFYQKHLSPHKGFSCAHRVLHGGESCSQYVKRVILERGLLKARPLIRQRFQACKAANEVLKRRRCDRRKKRQMLQGRLAYPSSHASLQLAMPDVPSTIFRMEGETPPDWDADQNALNESLEAQKPKVVDDAVAGIGANTEQERSQNACSNSSLDCSALDCIDATCAGLECIPDFEFGELSCDVLNCGELDCSSLDCGAADCGSCDVGSCG